MMFCWCALALLTLVPVVTGNNAGVKVTLNQRGLDYAVHSILRKMLLNLEIPDMEGTKCKVQYSLEGLKIYYMDNLKIESMFNTGTGVRIEVKNHNIYMSGNYTLIGSRKPLNVIIAISISAFVAVETDHPTFSMKECAADIAHLNDLQSSDSLSLISCSSYILRHYLASTICPKLKKDLGDLNIQLATMNATVSEYAEIDYSLMSVHISKTSIELGFKGLFYNTQQRKEPPFPPTSVPLAFQNTKMFYIAISAFTINSAFLVFHDAGVFNIRITDDMIPLVSPIRLSTMTFGAFIPQISEKYPDLKLELEVKTVKEPAIKFEPNNVILQLFSTVTAVHSDNTKPQLFVLNLESTARVQVSVTEDKLALALTLEKIDVSMDTKTLKFTNLNFLNMSIKNILFPIIKAHLAKGFPIPPGLLGFTIGKIHVNPQVEVLKDYMLIGTDIQFGENTSF